MADEWNPTATSFANGAALLKDRLVRCCTNLHMDPMALQLVKDNFPNDFNNFNDKPKGCVQIEVRITKQEGKQLLGSWTIEVDADSATAGARPQAAHYGYTVYSKGLASGDGKFTGHIWLPSNPPNYRPFLGEKKGQIVGMGPSKKTAGKFEYVLAGKMYNQYK